MITKDKKEIIYSIVLFGLPILLIIIFLLSGVNIIKQDEEPKTENFIEKHFQQMTSNAFNDLSLSGKAILVKDINSGKILYQKNADSSLPIASITKIMTAIVATEYLANSNSQIVYGVESSREGDGDYLDYGATFKLKKLRDYMLVSSSNDGAAAIALATQRKSPESDFVEKMNLTAKEIGMSRTHFLNETGLDENTQTAGAFGSANDVATLLEYTIKNYPEILEATRESVFYITSESGQYYTATNTNQIASTLPALIGSKTGYTELSGGNLAVVVDPSLNRPIIIVILGATQDGRFADAQKISEAVSKYFSTAEQSDTL